MNSSNSTKNTIVIKASRAKVYQALISKQDIVNWKVPDGMKMLVHTYEARKGGKIHISLTYNSPELAGKSSEHTDSYHGYFAELIPNEKIVEVDEFESNDPALQGKMTITITLKEKDGNTELTATHEGLPPGVLPKDNEEGWRMSLDKLATLVEDSGKPF